VWQPTEYAKAAVEELKRGFNMSKRLELKVEQDHVESLAKGKPLVAIEELIWNGLGSEPPSSSTVISKRSRYRS